MSGDHRPSPETRETADILFMARVKANKLRFENAPENRVEFTEDADGESGSRRTNLPDRVEERVTYSDVEIDYAIAAKLSVNRSP